MSVFYSCGTKPAKSNADVIKTSENYISEVNNSSVLKEEVTEGALTDKDGFKDIGKFRYSIFYNQKTKQLFRIKNIETTDKTIEENYYFKNNELIYISSSSKGKPDHKIYTKGFKVISKINTTDDEAKFLLKKAKRFKKQFEENH